MKDHQKAVRFSVPAAPGSGNGKIFYFPPGHETYPIFFNPVVQQVLRNAVRWAALEGQRWVDSCSRIEIENACEPLTQKGLAMHKKGEAGFR